jgi:hypothetical protein
MPKKPATQPLSHTLVTALATQARAHNRTMLLVCRLLVSLVLAAIALSRPPHGNTHKPDAEIGS